MAIEFNKLPKEKQDWLRQKTNRKIILRQGQSPGDILTFTRAVADLKKSYPDYQIDVRSPTAEIWQYNPHLTPLKDDDERVEIYEITYDEINISGWKGQHFSDAFRVDLEKKLGVSIKKTGIRPELYFSQEELSWFNQVHCDFSWNGPYWILNAGRKPDNDLKQYHRWQEVVDLLLEFFKDRVQIVQIGHKDHIHPPLKGVLNLIGKTDLRQLIRLTRWAAGSIGPISFQFVMSAAAFNEDWDSYQPSVCLAGGKEGVRWHLYPHIRYLFCNGALPCAPWDGCWLGGEKGKCKNLESGVPRCFRMIKPHMVSDAVKMYYEGGILKMPKKPQWLNKEKKKSIISKLWRTKNVS